MALIRISELPNGDSDLSPLDLVPFVDNETMQTKKLSIQALSDFVINADSSSDIETSTTDDLAEGTTNLYYTTERFDSDFAAHDPSDHLDSEHAWNVGEHVALQASIDGIPAQVDYVTKVGYNLADPTDTTAIVLDAGDVNTAATYKGNLIDGSANVIVDAENAIFSGTVYGATAGDVTTPDGLHTIIDAGTDQTDGTLDIANITATGDVDFTGATVTGLPVPTDAYRKTEVDALLDSERGQSV